MEGLLFPARLFNAADATLLCSAAPSLPAGPNQTDHLSKAHRFR